MSLPAPQFVSELTDAQIDTLAKSGVIPPNTPPETVALFAETCRQHDLSPFKKELYLLKYGNQYATIIGIDGLRAKAAKTGQIGGVSDTEYNRQSDGSFLTAAEIKQSGKNPVTATVTVYRIICGHRVPFTHTAVFSEFYGSGSGKSQSMPCQMISKVAEAHAWKKGFSDQLAGLHIEEEAQVFRDHAAPANIAPTSPWVMAIQEQFEGCSFGQMVSLMEGYENQDEKPDKQGLIQACVLMLEKADTLEDLQQTVLMFSKDIIADKSVNQAGASAKKRISK